MVSVKVFRPEKEFKNKKVAIVGAADSAFEEKKGNYIDSFDIVIRINKAPHSWNKEKAEYIGKKFTYLFHSYYENHYSGGGPMDWQLYKDLGIKKVINPDHSSKGYNTHLNYYKRHLQCRNTYLLARKNYLAIKNHLNGYSPTVGYAALHSVLQSECDEVYITGFTFFTTPYAKGYRKELEDPLVNKQHIYDQGIHNPELELKNLKFHLEHSNCKKIHLDNKLQQLLGQKALL